MSMVGGTHTDIRWIIKELKYSIISYGVVLKQVIGNLAGGADLAHMGAMVHTNTATY